MNATSARRTRSLASLLATLGAILLGLTGTASSFASPNMADACQTGKAAAGTSSCASERKLRYRLCDQSLVYKPGSGEAGVIISRLRVHAMTCRRGLDAAGRASTGRLSKRSWRCWIAGPWTTCKRKSSPRAIRFMMGGSAHSGTARSGPSGPFARGCGSITFRPNSDWGVWSIRAKRTSCRTARKVARKSKNLNVASGPLGFRANGFRCRGTRNTLGLTSVDWNCRRGKSRISFTRT